MKTEAVDLIKRHARNKADRNQIEFIWRDCYAVTIPIRGARWATGGVNASQKGGAEIGAAVGAQGVMYDETGADGARILAAALKDGGFPASSQWADLEVDGASDSDKIWLDKSARRLWKLMHNSNLDAEGFEAMIDYVIGGQFVLYVDEDPKEGGFEFEQWNVADCTWGRSRAAGRVDKIWREYTLTAEQCVAEFGDSRVSDQVREWASVEPDKAVSLLRCIYPRDGETGRFALNMPYASVTIEIASKHKVRESGYPWFPCVVPRWMALPSSEYGIGPAYIALPAMQQVNELIKLQLLGLEVHAGAGTYKAVEDGVFNPRTVRLGTRRVIIVGDMNNLQPLAEGGNLQATLLDIERLQKAIRKTFQADQLEPQDTGTKTATEIHIRVDMIRQQLGPMYGRLQSEFLAPLFELCFAMALARGAFETPPQTLQKRPFRVRFTSPLARAQQIQDVHAIDLYIQGTAMDMQLDQSVADNIDMPALNRIRAERLGVPREVLREKDKIERIQRQRAQAQAAQQAEQLQGAAAVAADAGQQRTAATAAAAGQQRMAGAS